jgi:hypothetical protein
MHYNTKQHPRKWMVNDLPNFRTKNSYFFHSVSCWLPIWIQLVGKPCYYPFIKKKETENTAFYYTDWIRLI